LARSQDEVREQKSRFVAYDVAVQFFYCTTTAMEVMTITKP